jgi:hypothetical protein
VVLALGVDVAIHAVEDRIEELLVLLEGLLEVLALGDVDGDPRQADDFALRPDDGRLDGQVAMPRAALLEEAGLPLLRALPGGKNLCVMLVEQGGGVGVEELIGRVAHHVFEGAPTSSQKCWLA